MLKALYILLMVGISLIPIYMSFHVQNGVLLAVIGLAGLLVAFITVLTLTLEEKDA